MTATIVKTEKSLESRIYVGWKRKGKILCSADCHLLVLVLLLVLLSYSCTILLTSMHANIETGTKFKSCPCL